MKLNSTSVPAVARCLSRSATSAKAVLFPSFPQPRAGVERSTGTGVARWAFAGALAGVLSWLPLSAGTGDSFVPREDSKVVARLRPAALNAAERELRTLRASLAQRPADLALAADVARRLIARSRAEADPRLLGQARAVLAPWWTNAAPPAEVLVLRATIRQSLHAFPAALADLEAALALDPRHAQAWLTKATIHTVRGEFDQARRACVPLLRSADELTATTAAATVASLTGEAARSVALLAPTLASHAGAPVATRVWALTQLAETTARLGRADEAERHFRAALALAPSDPYLLGACSDLLLDQQRPDEAAALVAGFTRIDGLLLRFAEARQAAGREARAAVEELTARFAAARARGDRVHQREEARFNLRLLNQPVAALALAQENWRVQKEPADARLLLEAARAARDSATEAELLAWVAANRLEDVNLRPLQAAARP